MDPALSYLVMRLQRRRRADARPPEIVVRPSKTPVTSESLSALHAVTERDTCGGNFIHYNNNHPHLTRLRATRQIQQAPTSASHTHTSECNIRHTGNPVNVSRFRLLDETSRGRPLRTVSWASTFLPASNGGTLDTLMSRGYVGRFIDQDGTFLSATQVGILRIYDTAATDHGVITHQMECMTVSWTITDVDCFSKRFVVYSSLNHLLHLVDLTTPNYRYVHETLDCSITHGQQALYSTMFSKDGRDVICGSGMRHGGGGIIMYHIPRSILFRATPAHDGDVNSVCYLSNVDPNLIVSAADDGVAKLWDIRTMRGSGVGGASADPIHQAVAKFVGHRQGLTHCDARGDGRFFITTSKDQTIKLWDVRRPSPADATSNIRLDEHFDYRIADAPPLPSDDSSTGDASVITFCGSHETMRTLMRSRFSPMSTTGCKYVYTCSRDGGCAVYDVCTGRAVKRLHGFHTDLIRDVSWHPTLPIIATTSWDQRVGIWQPGPCERECSLESDMVTLAPHQLQRQPSRKVVAESSGDSLSESKEDDDNVNDT